MKKTALILTVIMALGAGTLVFAQKPMKSFDGDKRAGQLKKELNLTDQQEQHLQTLMTGFREEMKTMMAESSLSREKKREKMGGFRENYQAAMKKILTEEQVVKLDELMANRLTWGEKEVIAEFRAKHKAFHETCSGNRRCNSDFNDRGEGRDREPGMRPQYKDCPEENFHKECRGKHDIRGVVRFLLLDPSIDQTGMADETLPVFIFPNPASDIVNVQLKNEIPQKVKIELFNKSGSLHEVLLESIVPAGTQTYSFEISHLPANDIYFIKTTNAQVVTVKKMLKD